VIVTRRRRKPFPWKATAFPALAIAAIAAVSGWAPSRAWIVNAVSNGPTGPAVRAVTTPFNLAAENRLLSERNARIRRLQAQVAQLRQAARDKDGKIGDLQNQIGQLQTQLVDAQNAASASPARLRAPQNRVHRTAAI
jgi:TolA-binding protein